MLATARACPVDEPSAARTVSELGTAPTLAGARSSCTVPATIAAPIGTIDNVRSSTLPVTAYSPASGSRERNPPGCWVAEGVVAGAGAVAGALVGSEVGDGRGVGAAGVAASVGPTACPFGAPLHAAPMARAKQHRMAKRPR